MIPKIIHFCWLSGDPYPEKIAACLASWKKPLADYEIWLWDLNRFDIKSSPWVKEAFEAKKYAFAADYIRCYALYHYGGVYLDSDVEVLKPYDDLLQLPYFFCKENDALAIEAATMGCEKGHPFFQEMLEYYKDRHFILENGTYDTFTLPMIMKKVSETHFEKIVVEDPAHFIYDEKTLCLFPKDYFSPIVDEKPQFLSKRTYSIHHYAGTWMPSWHKRIRQFILNTFGTKCMRRVSFVYQFFFGKK